MTADELIATWPSNDVGRLTVIRESGYDQGIVDEGGLKSGFIAEHTLQELMERQGEPIVEGARNLGSPGSKRKVR